MSLTFLHTADWHLGTTPQLPLDAAASVRSAIRWLLQSGRGKHGGWTGAFITTPLPADSAPAAPDRISRPKPTRADLGLQAGDELPLG